MSDMHLLKTCETVCSVPDRTLAISIMDAQQRSCTHTLQSWHASGETEETRGTTLEGTQGTPKGTSGTSEGT